MNAAFIVFLIGAALIVPSLLMDRVQEITAPVRIIEQEISIPVQEEGGFSIIEVELNTEIEEVVIGTMKFPEEPKKAVPVYRPPAPVYRAAPVYVAPRPQYYQAPQNCYGSS